MTSSDHVLVLGSAPDVLRARRWRRGGVDRIVAINNAWAVRPDWDHLVIPEDFPAARRPPVVRPGQQVHGHEDFVPAINAFGGCVYAGGTMVFTTAYWALRALRPRLIAILGCDMIYPTAGPSHFYGRGAADPLRPDPTLQSLEAKSARLQILAAEAGCAVVNLSTAARSRLVSPRVAAAGLAAWTAADGAAVCAAWLTPEAREATARARAAEAAADYRAADGRYWNGLGRIDPRVLRRIDALWLQAFRAYSLAA